jgi:hypothetical protein
MYYNSEGHPHTTQQPSFIAIFLDTEKSIVVSHERSGFVARWESGERGVESTAKSLDRARETIALSFLA